jgi:hypothetical protein
MRRLLIFFGIIVVLMFLSGALYKVSAGNGSAVIKDFWCYISPAAWGGPVPLTTYDTHSVGTPSGNVNETCKFDIPEGYEPPTAQKYTNFLCFTRFGLTTNSQSVVSPSGNIILQCKIKANK